jgi:hypothetical protein
VWTYESQQRLVVVMTCLDPGLSFPSVDDTPVRGTCHLVEFGRAEAVCTSQFDSATALQMVAIHNWARKMLGLTTSMIWSFLYVAGTIAP